MKDVIDKIIDERNNSVWGQDTNLGDYSDIKREIKSDIDKLFKEKDKEIQRLKEERDRLKDFIIKARRESYILVNETYLSE